MRSRTSISQTFPKDLEAKIIAFHREVRDVRENGDYELIADMDETPVFLDLVPSRTVDRKGRSPFELEPQIPRNATIQLLLAVLQVESSYPLLLHLKGKLPDHSRELVPTDVVVTMQQKAWMDEQRMLAWISQ